MDINSYDMFDTLFARKCYSPTEIFELVNSKYIKDIDEDFSSRDFVKYRILSEKDLYERESFNLDDIYQNLCEKYNFNSNECFVLKDMEYDTELENLIPIKENIDKLKPNDIVISDMYLHRDFIKKFLPKYVNLVVTNDGKSKGYIYNEISKHFNIIEHTGDNPHSDIKKAEENNIQTKLSESYVRTNNESLLVENNLDNVSNTIRKIRLGSNNADPDKRMLQILQTDVNYPILLFIFRELEDLCGKLDIKNILISGRDGEKLQRVCQTLSSSNNYRYFFTSRMSRKKSSNTYLEYVKREMDNKKSLIVDLDGTGWTLRNLKDKMKKYDTECFENMNFYLFHMVDESKMDGFIKRPYKVENYSIHYSFFTNKYEHNKLELLNLTNHPMVEDVVFIANNPIIKFFDNGHDNNTLEYIKVMDDLFYRFIPEIGYNKSKLLKEINNIDKEQFKSIIDKIYSTISDDIYTNVFDILRRYQSMEEEAVEQVLIKE